jgi:TRAP-type uncharacterized transport system substrate-binding protein
MNRRGVLRCAAAGGLWLALSGHSPYRQWEVHRKARLVLLVSAKEEQSVLLGRTLAAMYAKQLPASRATLARARDNNDLVRLMASKQLDVALLRERDASAAFAGEPPYGDAGALPLRALAVLGGFLFVCRDDLPNASAYMLTEALAAHWSDFDPALVGAAPGPRPAGALGIPLHPGALEYYSDHPAGRPSANQGRSP